MDEKQLDIKAQTELTRAWAEADYAGVCPVRQTLDSVGDKWTVLVVLRLGVEKQRFLQLLRAVDGISQRMLTVTLRKLERDGLVSRTVLDTRPPTVEYELTVLGSSLLKPIGMLAEWAIENQPRMDAMRAAYDEGEK